MPRGGGKKRGSRGKRQNNATRYERDSLPSNLRSAEAEQRHTQRAIAKRLQFGGADLGAACSTDSGAASSNPCAAEAAPDSQPSKVIRVSIDSDSDAPLTELDFPSSSEEESTVQDSGQQAEEPSQG